jgi:hypothetical protein
MAYMKQFKKKVPHLNLGTACLDCLIFEQQMSYAMQQSLQTNHSNPMSPVPPTNLNATTFSDISNTPEHLSTLWDRLMEYSIDYSSADGDREDAIGLMSLLDNVRDRLPE